MRAPRGAYSALSVHARIPPTAVHGLGQRRLVPLLSLQLTESNLQVITMPDARYEGYCNSSDFIRAHIFPGGHLPSMGAMAACASDASLTAIDSLDIGPDYAITLREWLRNWMAQWDAIAAHGYSDSFMRKCVHPSCACARFTLVVHACGMGSLALAPLNTL